MIYFTLFKNVCGFRCFALAPFEQQQPMHFQVTMEGRAAVFVLRVVLDRNLLDGLFRFHETTKVLVLLAISFERLAPL